MHKKKANISKIVLERDLTKLENGVEYSSTHLFAPLGMNNTSALYERDDYVWYTFEEEYMDICKIQSEQIDQNTVMFFGSIFNLHKFWDGVEKLGNHVFCSYPSQEQVNHIYESNHLKAVFGNRNRFFTAVRTPKGLTSPNSIKYIENGRIVEECLSGNIELYQAWCTTQMTNRDMYIVMKYVWLGTEEKTEYKNKFEFEKLKSTLFKDWNEDKYGKICMAKFLPVNVLLPEFYLSRLNSSAIGESVEDTLKNWFKEWNEES